MARTLRYCSQAIGHAIAQNQIFTQRPNLTFVRRKSWIAAIKDFVVPSSSEANLPLEQWIGKMRLQSRKSREAVRKAEATLAEIERRQAFQLGQFEKKMEKFRSREPKPEDFDLPKDTPRPDRWDDH